jgi:ferredoxin--NADP+ reductase
LSSRGVVHLSQGQWEKINAAEVSAGEVVGKPRLKFTKREEMLGLQ